jgi:hypothetical protein
MPYKRNDSSEMSLCLILPLALRDKHQAGPDSVERALRALDLQTASSLAGEV